MIGHCLRCGDPYEHTRSFKKYCSTNCQTRAAGDRYAARHPERDRWDNALQRHRERTGGKVTAREWMAILEWFDRRCAYCGVRDRILIEHVIPLGSGGTHDVDNIVPSCGSCNYVKDNRGPLVMVNRNFQLRAA